jgi:phytoene dehydrogenase-like protein
MAIEEFLGEWFESDVVKGALASQGVHGTSLGPMASGTTFRYLHRLVGMPAGMTVASSYVVGGAQLLWKQLADCVTKRGGLVWTSKQVVKVIVRGGRAVGVGLASGEELLARAVLSAADARRTFLELVDAGDLDPEFQRAVGSIKYRGAQARVLFALDSLRGLQVGDAADTRQGGLLFAPSIEYLERAADDAKYGRVSARPWFQATIASLAIPSLAPQGKHVLEVSVQYAPHRLADGDWDAPTTEALGDKVQSMLTESRGMVAPLARYVVTPLELEHRFGFPEGNPDQGEMTLDQILFLRPVPGWANSLTPVPGLYLCGAASHPGGGVNGRPGRLAARRVLTDLRRQRSRR